MTGGCELGRTCRKLRRTEKEGCAKEKQWMFCGILGHDEHSGEIRYHNNNT